MAVARELVGILTSAVPTLPVDLARQATDVPCFSFLSSDFGAHFGFQELLEDRSDRRTGCGFRWFLRGLQHVLAFFSL
jgi:hypothetical protein